MFESDSVTNIAHQLGYFETIASVDLFTSLPQRIAAVTARRGRPPPRERCSAPPTGRSAGSTRCRLEPLTLPRSSAGLWPARAALDNGAVVLAKAHARRRRPSPSTSRCGRVRSAIPPDAAGRDAGCCRASSIAAPRRDRPPRSPRSSTAAASALTITRDAAHPVSLVCTCLAEDFEPVLALLGDIVMHAVAARRRARDAQRARSSRRFARTRTIRPSARPRR